MEEKMILRGPKLIISSKSTAQFYPEPPKKEYLKPPKKEEKKDEEEIFEEKKEKMIGFLKKNYNWVIYIILLIIVYISVKIRTSNLSGLRDITTGGWTLGPDLDPFLFLRWAKYIVENGTLYVTDTMRYFPLGYNTKDELLLTPYMIAWFHKIVAIFGSGSVEQSAAIYPVFFFAITVIAFFLLVRKIFVDSLGLTKANIIALISSLFFSIIPVFLQRTTAGIPEKESSAFFFFFMALYFFLSAWKSKSNKSYIMAIFAGLSTAAMSLVWGGGGFTFFIISPLILISYFLGKLTKRRIYISLIWLFPAILAMSFFTTRYSIKLLLFSTTVSLTLAVIISIFVEKGLLNTRLKLYRNYKFLSKIPSKVLALGITILFGIIILIIVNGFSPILIEVNMLLKTLVNPVSDVLGKTISENRQPFFFEWASHFGPTIKNIPIFFWLFFTGSIYMFNRTIKMFTKKEKWVLTSSFTFLLISMIFGRYSSESIFNGTSTPSLILYSLGILVFFSSVGYYYYKYYKNGELSSLKKIDSGMLLVLLFFFLAVISAKGANRLIMILVPPSSIIVSYLITSLFFKARKTKESTRKLFFIVIATIVVILSIFSAAFFYKQINSTAKTLVPSSYEKKWQKAMFWVRENTPENAVFGHWWDYGYWMQSTGNRTTILDGGNAVDHWNYEMARHALTGTDSQKALEFLYAHNATHFLIDSTDLGKYAAFAKIGSDENNDRKTAISILRREPSQTKELKNLVSDFYSGGAWLDEDLVYDLNGTRIFLPVEKSFLVGISLKTNPDSGEIAEQPQGIFIYQPNKNSQVQQYVLPLRYGFDNELRDFGSGVGIGLYIIPEVFEAEPNLRMDEKGVLIVFSERSVKSQLVRLYIYEEENPYFKLVHSEDEIFVTELKSSIKGFDSDILLYKGMMRGPIKIWEINYPQNIELKEEYLNI